MKKKCDTCGTPVTGRVDKRFCSDQCRSNYHNLINRGPTQLIRRINRILRDNRRILAELNPAGKASVSRARLRQLGFRFDYFTNEFQTTKGTCYRFCYEQGYMVTEREYITLVVRKEYVG